MTPHEMLDALSRQTGAALAFNGDGLCRLRFDGGRLGCAPAPASSSASQPSALYFSFDATALRGRIPARAAGRFFRHYFREVP